MNKIERVRAALSCEAVDRPPYSFWTHLPGIDLDAQRLAEETAAFAARYDLDFIKSMPNGLYCVEDWGCVCDYSDIERGGVAIVVDAAVNAIEDWDKLGRVDVTQGSFGRELEHLAALVKHAGPVPVLATAFSPLTIASKLSKGLSREHVTQDPQAVRRGLEVITETTCTLVRETIARGCAGVFLALQEATRSAYDEHAYRAFGEPYDRRVLQSAKDAGGWFNAVHIHGEDILFDVVKTYDVSALNWHIGETPPAIAAYRSAGGVKPILGGLQRSHLTLGNNAAIEADMERAMHESQGRGLLLAPACVIRYPVREATLKWTAERIKACANRKG